MESLVKKSETLVSFVNSCLSSAKAPIVCWNQAAPIVEGAEFLIIGQKDPGSSDWIAHLGLSSRPTLLILRSDGSEFGRIDRHNSGVRVVEEVSELIRAFEAEKEILFEYNRTDRAPQALAEALSLFTIQRKSIESVQVWSEAVEMGAIPSTYMARRVGETAISRGRFDLAKPLFRHIFDSDAPEGERLEAWSRLIWCALTLGETEEARELSEGFNPWDSVGRKEQANSL